MTNGIKLLCSLRIVSPLLPGLVFGCWLQLYGRLILGFRRFDSEQAFAQSELQDKIFLRLPQG